MKLRLAYEHVFWYRLPPKHLLVTSKHGRNIVVGDESVGRRWVAFVFVIWVLQLSVSLLLLRGLLQLQMPLFTLFAASLTILMRKMMMMMVMVRMSTSHCR